MSDRFILDMVDRLAAERDATLARVQELEAKNEELEEELSIWESVFPDLAPENVLPDRSLVEAEVKRLQAEVKRLRAVFKDIAKSKLTDELEIEEWKYADCEGAYDCFISMARDALQTKGGENTND
ncbi:MAG: hypothetical protein OEZ19_08030 [Paracoccaceae bacterium]|nr:hypothetical protein [Paracoccaceae bacterium]